MGTIAIIGIFGLIVYVGFMLYRLAESWNRAVGQDALAHLDDQAQELQRLAAAKASALRDIKDLEFDYQTGHLTDEDYQGLRQKLERKAIAVMQRLDELRGATDFDAIIDQEMERRYGISFEEGQGEQPEATSPAAAPAPVPAPVVEARSAPVAEAGGEACQDCGHENAPGARFCSQCGATQVQQVVPRFCHDCGHGLEEGARFCASCGTPVRGAAVPVNRGDTTMERSTP